MRIAFHINQLSERGCELALFDYCIYSQSLLGHQPIVFYEKHSPRNDASVIRRFSDKFELVAYEHFSQVDEQITAKKLDLFYAIKGGEVDGIYSRRVPSMMHAVFAQSPLEIHGSSYAFISEWLAWKCTASLLPAVPFIVRPPRFEDPVSLRCELGIPLSATVFAGYGGSDSFNLEFVREHVIPQVLEVRDDVYFLFMNFTPFIQHPRVHFLPKTIDISAKERFVAAADAMLHARRQGESFGLACAEFSAQGKAIFSYRYTPDRHPQFLLGDAIHLYSSASDLVHQLRAFRRELPPPDGVRAYAERYSPEVVMELFDRYLIQPAVRAGGIGTALTVLTQPMRRPLSPLFRGCLWHLQIVLRRTERLLRMARAATRRR